jgi:hypothetical protein
MHAFFALDGTQTVTWPAHMPPNPSAAVNEM